MFENISIFFVNSSHSSVDPIISTLKEKVLSEQRPYITCLSYDEFCDEMANKNFENFLREFITKKLAQSRITLEKLQQGNGFNQLEFWKRDTKRTTNKIKKEDRKTMTMKNQSCMLRRDELREIILDFPIENNIELYLILFDVYDCDTIKSISNIVQRECESFMGIVNFYPRSLEKYDDSLIATNEAFWQKLVCLKFEDPSFDKIAFIDLDVPTEQSPYILSIRSQLIYDQFSHFIYDFELDIKSKYRVYRNRLNIHEVTLDAPDDKDLKQLENKLNEIPICMLTIEKIYDALLETIAPLNDVHARSSRHSLNLQSRVPFEIAAFGKTFRDMTDKWLNGCKENSKIYSNEILKLESLHDVIWRDAEAISIERRQILNYFMAKIADYLGASGDEKELQHPEFYIYTLEFTRWHHQRGEDNEFYENRSVGHINKTFHEHLRASSDIRIDYKNHTRIPIEIEHLTNDEAELKGVQERGDFYVQFYCKSSMLQLLENLTKANENFQRQHFTLFDVMLLKFQPTEREKMYSTKSYKKILPTPLCFRDFNDYGKFFHRPSMDSLVDAIQHHDDGDKCISSQHFKPEHFLLQTSIKWRKQQENAESEGKLKDEKEQRDELTDTALKSPSIDVFDSTNKYTEFNVSESNFTSFELNVRVQLYNWINFEEHLNISCNINDAHLSFSDDLRANKFRNATLHDELSGMICSIDMNNGRKIISTFPHGMRVSIADGKSIEFDWMRLCEGSSVADEYKRIFFSNGFVMVCSRNDTVKVYSPAGTIYEFTKSSSRTKILSNNSELTKRLQFSINSIHFLDTLINISSYTMTLFSGNRYRVENGSIVEEIRSMLTVRELCIDEVEGNTFFTRDDNLKLLLMPCCTKCLYPDGTLIVTKYDHKLTASISPTEVTEKPLSILDEIWLSDAEISGKFELEATLESIDDDYFLCMNRTYQFEHKFYGRIQFSDENFSNQICEMEFYNGSRFKLERDCEQILITTKNGSELRLSEAELQFCDRKCCECRSSNKLSINITSNDKIDSCNNRTLACACDIDGNSLEVQQSNDTRRVVFYKAWKYKAECRRCSKMKEDFNIRHFSERWLIVNRDMTGYEIFPQKPTSMDAWIETNDSLLYRSSDAYEILIDDKDLHIDIEYETTSPLKASMTQVESNSISKSQQSQSDVRMKKKKNGVTAKRRRKSSKKEEALVIEKLSHSPWVTLDSSITTDISLEHRELIEFYVNPLHDLPETLDVSLVLKLQRDYFTNVTDALQHLKKYIGEKFIINTSKLMTNPLNKKTFDENFGFIVRKSMEEHVEGKLEQIRNAMARAIIEDLLENAFNALEKKEAAAATEKTETRVSHVIENETRGETAVASAAIPIPIKSFSFV